MRPAVLAVADVRTRGSRAWLALATAVTLAATAVGAGAQQRDTVRAAPDSARAAPGTARRDSAVRREALRPPLSPRRAFLYSLAVPGSAQAILGRPTAAALFVLGEAVTVTMIRETRANLREAQRFQGDSIVITTVDPQTGQPRVIKGAPRYPEGLVRARKAQVEDWIAALVANHLFSGADAFVAAHLWDVPAQLSLRAAPGATTLAARFRW